MIYNDTSFIGTFPQLQNNTEITSLINACAYANSTGNIKDAIKEGGALNSTDKISAFSSTITDFDNFRSTYGVSTEPTTMTYYKNQLTELRNFGNDDANDFPTSYTNLNYVNALASLNSMVDCANDQWVINDSKCTVSPIWTAANIATYSNDATAICINVKTFVTTAGQSLTTRYTGTCADSVKADIQTSGTNLANFITNYEEQIDRMLGTVGDKGLDDVNHANWEGSQIISKLNASLNDMNVFKVNFEKTVSFISSFSDNLSGFVNCKVIRTDLVIFSNTFCHEFTYSFAEQAIYFAGLGPLLCLLVLCGYCNITRPIIKVKGKSDESGVDDDNKVHALSFLKRVDKKPKRDSKIELNKAVSKRNTMPDWIEDTSSKRNDMADSISIPEDNQWWNSNINILTKKSKAVYNYSRDGPILPVPEYNKKDIHKHIY